MLLHTLHAFSLHFKVHRQQTLIAEWVRLNNIHSVRIQRVKDRMQLRIDDSRVVSTSLVALFSLLFELLDLQVSELILRVLIVGEPSRKRCRYCGNDTAYGYDDAVYIFHPNNNLFTIFVPMEQRYDNYLYCK